MKRADNGDEIENAMRCCRIRRVESCEMRVEVNASAVGAISGQMSVSSENAETPTPRDHQETRLAFVNSNR